MSAVQINFKSASQAGGTGGDAIQTSEYDSLTAALGGVSGDFLVVNDPVGRGGDQNAAAYHVDTISSIVLIDSVTFGTVSED